MKESRTQVNTAKALRIFCDSLKKDGKIPRLLLHSCCAPCSSYVLEYLSSYFYITVLYYNPNIYPPSEYEFRKEEQRRLTKIISGEYPIEFKEIGYDHNEFLSVAKGLENEPERGKRCENCYGLRLEKTAEIAKIEGFDYFATTLTISPQKSALTINEIGKNIERQFDCLYLESDFKKENGYLRSCELSREYGMYRQDYCGCEFSKNNKPVR